jgi:hypothetical protein
MGDLRICHDKEHPHHTEAEVTQTVHGEREWRDNEAVANGPRPCGDPVRAAQSCTWCTSSTSLIPRPQAQAIVVGGKRLAHLGLTAWAHLLACGLYIYLPKGTKVCSPPPLYFLRQNPLPPHCLTNRLQSWGAAMRTFQNKHSGGANPKPHRKLKRI